MPHDETRRPDEVTPSFPGIEPAHDEVMPFIVEDYTPVNAAENYWWTADMVAAHLRTTRRTVLRWVNTGQLPRPKKFGKLSRWPKDFIERIAREGIPELEPGGNELRRLPPQGVAIVCPHCLARLNVTRAGAELVERPPEPEPLPEPVANPMPTASKRRKPSSNRVGAELGEHPPEPVPVTEPEQRKPRKEKGAGGQPAAPKDKSATPEIAPPKVRQKRK